MTKKAHRDAIEKLLRMSNWQGNGPHGGTINAVMRHVDAILRSERLERALIRPDHFKDSGWKGYAAGTR